MRKTQITKLRANGKGIAGTYENIEHHANAVEVFARTLEPLAPHWGFKAWKQGSNVHQFECHHGKVYTLRPVWNKGDEEGNGRGYNGVALSLRVSRSQEFTLTHCTRVSDIPRLSEMMRLLAKSQPGVVGSGLEHNSDQ